MSEPLITLNGEPHPWRPGLTVQQLLTDAGLGEGEATRIATALNAQFLPRTQRASTELKPGDALTTFAAIVGG